MGLGLFRISRVPTGSGSHRGAEWFDISVIPIFNSIIRGGVVAFDGKCLRMREKIDGTGMLAGDPRWPPFRLPRCSSTRGWPSGKPGDSGWADWIAESFVDMFCRVGSQHAIRVVGQFEKPSHFPRWSWTSRWGTTSAAHRS